MQGRRVILTGIAMAAALGISGAARAQVPDGFWRIVDDKQPATSAEVAMAGSTSSVSIEAVCEDLIEGDAAEGSAILVETEHPDRVRLRKNRGDVEQSQKANPTIVTLVTGSGEQQIRNPLECEKAEAQAQIKNQKQPNSGSFEAFGKECECVAAEGGDCSQFTTQIGILAAKCQRNDTVDVRFSDKNQNLRKFKVKGKGDAFVED